MRTAAVGAWVAGAIVLAGSAAPAMAAEEELPNCWADLSTGEHLCVPAEEDIVAAVAEQKGVQIVLPGESAPDLERASDGSALQSSTVLALMYDDANYSGSSFTLSISSGSCGTHTYSDLHQFGWGDRISSFRSFQNCRGTIFEHQNLSGAQYGPAVNAPGLAGMNDKGSSFRVAP